MGTHQDTAYIGLAYALRGDQREAHYVTCCSQAFDMDGGSMQLVAFEACDPVKNLAEARRNPFLSKDGMLAVLARSLELYQGRNGGILSKRLVIHKTTVFKTEEIEGAFDALSGIEEIECIEIGTASLSCASGYDGRSLKQLGAHLGRRERAWGIDKGELLSGKKSIPKPLLLTRHAGSGPHEIIAHEALALTKVDWNNDALYDPVPVSIRYSKKLARTIANAPDLPGNVYPYRLFM